MTIEEAISVIQESRATHVVWAEYLEDPDNTTEPDVLIAVGRPAFHHECVERYDGVLEVLHRFRKLIATENRAQTFRSTG